jgi:hypothetical protein
MQAVNEPISKAQSLYHFIISNFKTMFSLQGIAQLKLKVNEAKQIGLTKNSGGKLNFEVIDTIRFIAMLSIVWGHCSLGAENSVYTNTTETVLQSIILQIGKLGTIVFFLISGFLMEPKLAKHTPWGFVKLRFKSIILPWMISVVVLAFLTIATDSATKVAYQLHHYREAVMLQYLIFKNSIFYFAYWFIVVYMITAVLLIALRKHIYKLRLGLVFLAITAFYCLNLHYAWVSQAHTKAFLGYVFFMWLGMQISRYYHVFMLLLKKTNFTTLISLLVIGFAASCYEGIHLTQIGCTDPFASIRFTSSIASILLFVTLFKIGKINWINQFEPRRTVYGIYLLHNLVIFVLVYALRDVLHTEHFNLALSKLILAELAVFAAVLVITYACVNYLTTAPESRLVTLANKVNYQVSSEFKIGFNLLANQRKFIFNGMYQVVKVAVVLFVPFIYYINFVLKLVHLKVR